MGCGTHYLRLDRWQPKLRGKSGEKSQRYDDNAGEWKAGPRGDNAHGGVAESCAQRKPKLIEVAEQSHAFERHRQHEISPTAGSVQRKEGAGERRYERELPDLLRNQQKAGNGRCQQADDECPLGTETVGEKAANQQHRRKDDVKRGLDN